MDHQPQQKFNFQVTLSSLRNSVRKDADNHPEEIKQGKKEQEKVKRREGVTSKNTIEGFRARTTSVRR